MMILKFFRLHLAILTLVPLIASDKVGEYVLGRNKSNIFTKRDVSDESTKYQSGVRYDEYPLVVPKRAALLLDRMMVAIQNALENEHNLMENDQLPVFSRGSSSITPETMTEDMIQKSVEDRLGLQRRGHGAIGDSSLRQNKGRVYWRCYFNAVTCFK